MQTALLLSFFLTPFLASGPYDGSMGIESLIFVAFLMTLVLQPQSLNIIAAYKKAAFKGLVLSPILLLAFFLISSLETSNPFYKFIPYFTGYCLIFLAAFRIGWKYKRLNVWLKYLPFLIAAAAVVGLENVNHENGMQWTEFSLLIGFGGLLAAAFCNVRSLTGFFHCGLFIAASILTVMSMSVAGIMMFGILTGIIGLQRLNRTHFSFGMRFSIVAICLTSSVTAVALSSDADGHTVAQNVQKKFENHFVSSIEDQETATRVRIYDLQLALFRKHWQFGVGLDQFKNMNDFGHGGVPLVNHNNFLKCLSEGGISVGIAYVIFIYYLLRAAIKVFLRFAKSNASFSLPLIVLACGITFLIVRGFAMDTLFLRQFFVLAGLFAGKFSIEIRQGLVR